MIHRFLLFFLMNKSIVVYEEMQYSIHYLEFHFRSTQKEAIHMDDFQAFHHFFTHIVTLPLPVIRKREVLDDKLVFPQIACSDILFCSLFHAADIEAGRGQVL